ncbi:MAG: sigma-70 family RNA polymerase sigma factor [Acidimicrobiales bacterium]
MRSSREPVEAARFSVGLSVARRLRSDPRHTLAPADRRRLATADDATLVALARAGSVHACEALALRYWPLVAHVARRHARALDADDVVGDVMASLWSALSRGKGPSENVAGYLAVSARRAAHARLQLRLDEWLVGEAELLEDLARDHRTGLDDDDTDHQDLIAGLAQLTARQRQVLWLTIVEGRPPQELAARLGISANASAALAMRARRSLARAMAPTATSRAS